MICTKFKRSSQTTGPFYANVPKGLDISNMFADGCGRQFDMCVMIAQQAIVFHTAIC